MTAFAFSVTVFSFVRVFASVCKLICVAGSFTMLTSNRDRLDRCNPCQCHLAYKECIPLSSYHYEMQHNQYNMLLTELTSTQYVSL